MTTPLPASRRIGLLRPLSREVFFFFLLRSIPPLPFHHDGALISSLKEYSDDSLSISVENILNPLSQEFARTP